MECSLSPVSTALARDRIRSSLEAVGGIRVPWVGTRRVPVPVLHTRNDVLEGRRTRASVSALSGVNPKALSSITGYGVPRTPVQAKPTKRTSAACSACLLLSSRRSRGEPTASSGFGVCRWIRFSDTRKIKPSDKRGRFCFKHHDLSGCKQDQRKKSQQRQYRPAYSRNAIRQAVLFFFG